MTESKDIRTPTDALEKFILILLEFNYINFKVRQISASSIIIFFSDLNKKCEIYVMSGNGIRVPVHGHDDLFITSHVNI